MSDNEPENIMKDNKDGGNKEYLPQKNSISLAVLSATSNVSRLLIGVLLSGPTKRLCDDARNHRLAGETYRSFLMRKHLLISWLIDVG